MVTSKVPSALGVTSVVAKGGPQSSPETTKETVTGLSGWAPVPVTVMAVPVGPARGLVVIRRVVSPPPAGAAKARLVIVKVKAEAKTKTINFFIVTLLVYPHRSSSSPSVPIAKS
jgi:hypothetical protein